MYKRQPYLYKLYVSIQDDKVECYFAMRCFSIEKDDQQIPRICLNHQPIFMNGVLDQGYWPDGLYTAPTDEALIYDIETMKSLGFNMIRKHIKIEPARWYYHCDRLGMIVCLLYTSISNTMRFIKSIICKLLNQIKNLMSLL